MVCKRCGASFSRPSSLRRHRAERRCPGRAALVPARSNPAPIRAAKREALDVSPGPLEIVPATRPVARPGSIVRVSGDVSTAPAWLPSSRARKWPGMSETQRRCLAEEHGSRPVPGTRLIRTPDEADAATLWEQYHFLKALAVRLDTGRGAERDRSMFEAGLREYDANYDRIAQRKALPG